MGRHSGKKRSGKQPAETVAEKIKQQNAVLPVKELDEDSAGSDSEGSVTSWATDSPAQSESGTSWATDSPAQSGESNSTWSTLTSADTCGSSSSSSSSDSHKKCSPTKAAETIIAAFITGDIAKILSFARNDTLLIVPDQTEVIPYAGEYVGPVGIVEFFAKFAAYVTVKEAKKLATYSAPGGKVIVTVFINQVNKLNLMMGAPTEEFSFILDFSFTFDEKCKVKTVFVNFETGPLVLFYDVIENSSDTVRLIDAPEKEPAAVKAEVKVIPPVTENKQLLAEKVEQLKKLYVTEKVAEKASIKSEGKTQRIRRISESSVNSSTKPSAPSSSAPAPSSTKPSAPAPSSTKPSAPSSSTIKRKNKLRVNKV